MRSYAIKVNPTSKCMEPKFQHMLPEHTLNFLAGYVELYRNGTYKVPHVGALAVWSSPAHH